MLILSRLLSLVTMLAGTILDDIGTAIQSVAEWITNLFTSIIPIFWDATATTPTFTFIGWLTVVGFGLGLVFAVLRVVRSFVRL
jgi:hypothetical protein